MRGFLFTMQSAREPRSVRVPLLLISFPVHHEGRTCIMFAQAAAATGEYVGDARAKLQSPATNAIV